MPDRCDLPQYLLSATWSFTHTSTMAPRIRPLDRATLVKWLKSTHVATETFNISRWLSDFMTPDLELKFYSQPTVQGADSVRTLLSRLFSHLESLTHEIQHVDYVPPRIYQSCRAHYLLKGDRMTAGILTIDTMAVFHVNEEIEESGERRPRCYKLELYGDFSEVRHKIEDWSKKEVGAFDMF